MKSKVEADKQKRFFFMKSEKALFSLRSISFYNTQGFKLIQILPKKARLSSIRNRCVFTGRSRSVLKVFKFSRIYMHALLKKTSVCFIRKASWLILFLYNIKLIRWQLQNLK